MVLAQSLLSLAESLRRSKFARRTFASGSFVSVSLEEDGFAGKFNLGKEFYTCPSELTKGQNQVLGDWNALILSEYEGPYALCDTRSFAYPDGASVSVLGSCLGCGDGGVTYLAAVLSSRIQAVLIISFLGRIKRRVAEEEFGAFLARMIYQKVASKE